MLGCDEILRSDWGEGTAAERISVPAQSWGGASAAQRVGTAYLELLELAGLLPPALPDALHALDGDEALAGPLCARARAALHRAQRRSRRQGRVPVAQPDGAERAVADELDGRVRPGRVCARERGGETGAAPSISKTTDGDPSWVSDPRPRAAHAGARPCALTKAQPRAERAYTPPSHHPRRRQSALFCLTAGPRARDARGRRPSSAEPPSSTGRKRSSPSPPCWAPPTDPPRADRRGWGNQGTHQAGGRRTGCASRRCWARGWPTARRASTCSRSGGAAARRPGVVDSAAGAGAVVVVVVEDGRAGRPRRTPAAGGAGAGAHRPAAARAGARRPSSACGRAGWAAWTDDGPRQATRGRERLVWSRAAGREGCWFGVLGRRVREVGREGVEGDARS